MSAVFADTFYFLALANPRDMYGATFDMRSASRSRTS